MIGFLVNSIVIIYNRKVPMMFISCVYGVSVRCWFK
jgi:hypothetical protein